MRRGPALAAMTWACVAGIVSTLIMPWVEAFHPHLDLPDLTEMGGFITPLVIAVIGAGATRAYERRNGGNAPGGG